MITSRQRILAMLKLDYNPNVVKQLQSYISNPSQCLIIVGDQGSGKTRLLQETAASILKIDVGKLFNYPFQMLVEPNEKNIITIDKIKQIKHFISLQIPSDKSSSINRIVLIDDADRMNTVSQNAILKNIEEPPARTIFILTATNLNDLLITIKSRSHVIKLNSFSQQDIEKLLLDLSVDQIKIKQYVNLANRSLKKAHEIANYTNSDQATQTYNIAKQIITSNRYNRLVLVNLLAKDRDLTVMVVQTILTMADNALSLSTNKQTDIWLNILVTSYQTLVYLQDRSNLKLTLTYLMVNL